MEERVRKMLNEVTKELWKIHSMTGVNMIEQQGMVQYWHIEDIDLYLKLIWEEDSYGGERLDGFEIVVPKVTQIVEFE